MIEPFIKLEDRTRRFRPYFETLGGRWPKINVKPGRKGCIFAPDEPKPKPKLEDGGAYAGGGDLSPESPKRNRRTSRKLDFDHAQNEGQRKPEASIGMSMTMKSTSLNKRKPNRPGYCELCCVDFNNMEEHLDSDGHKDHFDDDCFKELDEEMNSGPTLASFYKEVTGKDLPNFDSPPPKRSTPGRTPRSTPGRTPMKTPSRNNNHTPKPSTPASRRRQQSGNRGGPIHPQTPRLSSTKPSPSIVNKLSGNRQTSTMQLRSVASASPKPSLGISTTSAPVILPQFPSLASPARIKNRISPSSSTIASTADPQDISSDPITGLFESEMDTSDPITGLFESDPSRSPEETNQESLDEDMSSVLIPDLFKPSNSPIYRPADNHGSFDEDASSEAPIGLFGPSNSPVYCPADQTFDA